MKPSTTVKKDDKDKTTTSKPSTTVASKIGATSKINTGTTKTTTTGSKIGTTMSIYFKYFFL